MRYVHIAESRGDHTKGYAVIRERNSLSKRGYLIEKSPHFEKWRLLTKRGFTPCYTGYDMTLKLSAVRVRSDAPIIWISAIPLLSVVFALIDEMDELRPLITKWPSQPDAVEVATVMSSTFLNVVFEQVNVSASANLFINASMPLSIPSVRVPS